MENRCKMVSKIPWIWGHQERIQSCFNKSQTKRSHPVEEFLITPHIYLFHVYFPILKLNYPLIKYKFPTLHLNFPLLDFEYPTFQFDFPELHFMVPFLQSDHPNLRFNFPVMRNQLSTIWIQISSFRDEFSNTMKWLFHNWN